MEKDQLEQSVRALTSEKNILVGEKTAWISEKLQLDDSIRSLNAEKYAWGAEKTRLDEVVEDQTKLTKS